MIKVDNYLIPIKEIEYVEYYNKCQIYIFLKGNKRLTVNVDRQDAKYDNTYNSIINQFNMILRGEDNE